MTEQVEQRRIAWNDGLAYIPGEVLVKFRAGVSETARIRAADVARGGIDTASMRWIGDVLVARAPGEPDSEAFAAAVRRQPEVQWAQPNYLRRVSSVPNDPGYEKQWNFDLIGMPSAWDISDGASEKIVVAVIDTGVTTVTQSFDLRLWTGRAFETVATSFRVNPDLLESRVTAGRDFVFWDGPVVDMVGHGTHVAGTVLQETNNGLGLAGIAHRAHLLPLKACYGYWEMQFWLSDRGVPGFVRLDETGSCPDAAVGDAIRFAADSGAQVINLSLGGPDPSPVLEEALRYAVDRGAFVAIAVGNEFVEGNPISYPAKYAESIDGVVAVGAVGRSGLRAYYSNTGSYIELVAPGGDVREGGLPAAIYQASLLEADFDPASTIRPRFERYAEVASQGTSMAAPHVAGVAALLYARGMTQPSAIEAALETYARDLGEPGRDAEFGFGLIDARAVLQGLGAIPR
jgi:serine protease